MRSRPPNFMILRMVIRLCLIMEGSPDIKATGNSSLKTSCRAIALEQVKRELLEELGTYVEATTIVQDAQIEKDEIKTLSAGIVQTKVLDEKWDGREYWLKAEVSADPDEVAASIDKLRNDQQLAEELAESQAEKEDALKEVDRLKAELAQSNANKEKLAQYNQAVNQLQASDSFEQGSALTIAGDYEGAAKEYDRVIYYRPNDAKAFFNRSIVFIYLGNYNRATTDLDRAMVLRPANTNSYFQRASAYKNISENRIINRPYQGRPFPGRPYRPKAPKYDPLQKYLDKKQAEHRLVKVNPFRPRPIVKRDPKYVPPRALQPKQERPVIGQPVKPDIYKKGDVPPPARMERKPPVVTPRVDGERGGIQKRDLNEEQKRTLQQRKKEQNEQRALEMQQRRDLRKKEGSFAREPVKPEIRKQVNVPQSRVEKKPPVVQPKRDVSAPKAPQPAQQQKVNTKKQIQEEELEKASRRR